jgi:hypothetical protein
MNDLYVYYKVRREHADQLEMNLRIMQAELGAGTGIYGDIKRRPVEKDGVQTWMESYLATGPGFEDTLDAAVREAGLAQWISGERHTEIFTDLDPCA